MGSDDPTGDNQPFTFASGLDPTDPLTVYGVDDALLSGNDWVGIYYTGNTLHMSDPLSDEGYWRVHFKINWGGNEAKSYNRQFFIKYDVTIT